MSSFTFREPNTLDKLVSKAKYLPRLTLNSKLTDFQTSALKQLHQDGYVVLENFVTPSVLDSLKNDMDQRFKSGNIDYPVLAQTKIDPVKHSKLIDNYLYGSKKEFRDQNLVFEKSDFTNYQEVLEKYKPSTLEFNIPKDRAEYFNLWLNPTLLGIVEAYLGIKPHLIEAYVRRNFPSPYRTMNHFWHRDLNNKFHLLKFFIFFTDCNLKTGPHEFIAGSHKDFSLNSQRYFEDHEVETTHADKKIQSVVKAGTIILEDTRGLHRAALPLEGNRDLGYGVFFPLPWFRSYKQRLYEIESSCFESLMSSQQQYIPSASII